MCTHGLMTEQLILHTAISTFFLPNSWPLTLEPNLMLSSFSFLTSSNYDAHLTQGKKFFSCFSVCVYWCFIFYQPEFPHSSNNKHRKLLSPGRTDRAWERKSSTAHHGQPLRNKPWPRLDEMLNICWVHDGLTVESCHTHFDEWHWSG